MKKLLHYIQEHPITVVRTVPIAENIGNKDATDRIAKWAIDLEMHTVLHKPRTAIKSHFLADFFADWTETQDLLLFRTPHIGACTSKAPR